MSIPQIDIAPFLAGDPAGRRAVVRQWAQAFETVGFATIAGHGVADRLIEDLHAAALQFFDLPVAVKRRCSFAGEARSQGYVGLAGQSLARTVDANAPPAPPDLFEGLTFQHCNWERDGIRNDFDQSIFRPNLWPTEPPGLRSLIEAYFDQVYDLAQNLMRIGALAIDLPEDYFAPYYERMSTQLRLTHYPDQPTAPLPGQLRSGAHHDYLGFTILRQDDAPGGLQVRAPDGGWIDVKPVPGSFVINAGDLLARWTNGRWKSNLHRVVNPPRELGRTARRISIVFFTGPNHDAMISCLPGCQSADNPPRYPAVRAWDHFMEKVRASMATGGY
ncbi:MAG: 2OG-Fe(II) oxygenase family protein [Pseudomonadota bacterium]